MMDWGAALRVAGASAAEPCRFAARKHSTRFAWESNRLQASSRMSDTCAPALAVTTTNAAESVVVIRIACPVSTILADRQGRRRIA